MAGGTPRSNAIFSPVAKPAPATIYFLFPKPTFPLKLFLVFLNKFLYVRPLKPYHGTRLFLPFAGAFPSDTRDLFPLCKLIYQGQGASENLTDIPGR
jgi:hypothetical protein